MSDIYADIHINAGVDFRQEVRIDPDFDYEDYSFVGKLTQGYLGAPVIPFQFESVENKPNYVALVIPKSVTTTLRPGRYHYDVLATNNETEIVSRLIYGIADVHRVYSAASEPVD